jgi:hypothetical protein
VSEPKKKTFKISRRNFMIGGAAAAAAVTATGLYFGLQKSPTPPSSLTTTTSTPGSSLTVPPLSSDSTISSLTTTVFEDATDVQFFYERYSGQTEGLRSWLMQPWSETSSNTYGFDPNYQMVRGGNWPGYSDSLGNNFNDGYHPGMVIIDNNFQHGLSLDWFNAQVGISTHVNQTVRYYLENTQFVDPAVSASPSIESYNGTDRRETFFGKLSPSYGKLTCIMDTASQIWYVPGHTLSDSDPIVTALPTDCLSDSPSPMETFGPKMLLEYMQGDIEQTTADFLNVINSWQSGSPGQLGAPYDTQYRTRSLDFTIIVSRCCKDSTGTYFWQRPDVQQTLQEIIDTLWASQLADGSMAATYFPNLKGASPESTGEALLAFDPNLPSRFN